MSATHLRVVQQLLDDQPVEYQKFGIVGDGVAYDHAGIASLIAALEDFGTVELGGRPRMLLGQPIVLTNRESVCLTTGHEPDTSNLTSAFLWDGPKGGDMLVLDRCRNVTLDGFVFETNDPKGVRAPAGRAIVLDGGMDTNPAQPFVFGTTCTLRRLRHVTFLDPALQVAADFITIAPTTKFNQEFHEIIECGGNGNGKGRFLHIGPSPNAKNIKLEKSRYIDAYDKAVQIDNGSLKMRHNNMSVNQWDIYAGASTGYITEEHHIGEGSIRHAFINCPYEARWGTYDNSRTRPRSEPMPDLPLFGDEIGHTYEEAWIMFGGNAIDVTIKRCAIGPARSPDTRVFGWMYDHSMASYWLGPFWLDPGHTRRTLGIDKATLDQIMGTMQLEFLDRAHDVNPGGPGVQDLPCGHYRYNHRGTIDERQSGLAEIAPTTLHVATDAPDFSVLANGDAQLYETPAQVRIQQKSATGAKRQGVVGQMTVKG